MFDLIRKGWRRVVRFFIGEEVSTDTGVAENTEPEIPVAVLPTSPVPVATNEVQYDLSRWIVTEHLESPFEKVGRLYIEGDNLVIRSDLDTRGFYVRLIDVVAVLDGESQPVRLLVTDEEVGVVRLSTSGKAMNITIAQLLYTIPLRNVIDVLEGKARKAAVFVGREG